MAKKYLLYIHDSDRFSKEMYKSELVNKLLRRHYSKHLSGDYVAPLEDIETLKDSFQVIKPPQEAAQQTDRDTDWRECKNGHAIPAFQVRCLGKGCQYG